MFKRRLTTSIGVLAVLAGMAVVVPVATAFASTDFIRHVSAAGTSSSSANGPGADALLQPNELGPLDGDTLDAAGNSRSNGVNRSRSIAHTAPSVPLAPIAPGVGVSSSGPLQVLSSFAGLNHRQNRLANGGHQFSLEPPDQGLCAGNGFQMEIINDVRQVYDTGGHTLLPATQDINHFFGFGDAIDRATKTQPLPIFGEFATDPSCYYDKDTNTWFAIMLGIGVYPVDDNSDPNHPISGGDFTGVNEIDIAVSNSGDPTGTWTLYHVDITDDGSANTPDHGCHGISPYGQSTVPDHPNACLGDYPHLGADANGIYITTNEYSFFGNDFHGAQVYAISKQSLAHHDAVITVVQKDTHNTVGGVNSGFTIWPATAPNDINSADGGGTEYLMSSNAADEAHGDGVAVGPRQSNQLLVWSVTNTSSLNSAAPSLGLSFKTLTVGKYVVPARSEQKVGATPLIDCLNKHSCAANFVLGVPDPFAPEHEYGLDSNDTRMQQVVFADGMLWGALDTAVNSSANTNAGIEWFIVNPAGGTLVKSGYLAVSQENVIYPAIAVSPGGHGVMAFTLVGRDFYPSAAFASISTDGTGAVQVAAMGAGPADGFSGTAVFNAPNPAHPRWGDYGAAVYDNGNIWIASEYIGQTCNLATYVATGASCGGTRTLLANWATRLTEVKPS